LPETVFPQQAQKSILPEAACVGALLELVSGSELMQRLHRRCLLYFCSIFGFHCFLLKLAMGSDLEQALHGFVTCADAICCCASERRSSGRDREADWSHPQW
jgi:hypothetical protein